MPGILDRHTARVQTAEIRRIGGPLLQSVVDRAAGVFERCSHTAPDGDENLGILMPFHHAIEMLDGVEVLLDQSCVAAAGPLLRSAFEANLAIRYVLEEDTRRRGLAYVADTLRERIHRYERWDPATPAGQQNRAAMAADFPFPDPDEARERAEALRSSLSEEPYDEISAAFEEARKKRRKRRRPPWYSLFGGPQHLRELADHLGELDDYLILYDTWSDTAHATDLDRQLTHEDGEAAVRVIRSPIGMPTAYVLAAQSGVGAVRHVLEHYRGDEMKQFARWYLHEIAPVTKRLEAIKETEA